MKAAQYVGCGRLEIVDLPLPECPTGGLLVKTQACGLCSGELMDWYMDKKAPHVFGHEVSGIVVESQNAKFPVGSQVMPHHHAPCGRCEFCRRQAYVHCKQWKSTRLNPGGMAEYFAVAPENLSDTHLTNGIDPLDAALIEPLACVIKAIRRGQPTSGALTAVIGAGALGLMHGLMLGDAVTFETREDRRESAIKLGLDCRPPSEDEKFEVIFVLPGSAQAIEFAGKIAAPDARIVLFAPLPPGELLPLNLAEHGYFQDFSIIHSYSCGPNDTLDALNVIKSGRVRASQVVSDFVRLDDLPEAYDKMKRSEILKAMVVFDA